jgi:copper(I)-binding protein
MSFGASAQKVSVSDAWARATLPAQTVGAAYLKITSDEDARLVGVKSSAAKTGEIHSMRHEEGVMRMRKLDALPLPAGQSVALEPGGDHIMLLDLRRPLQAGQTIDIELLIERAGQRKSMAVQAKVKAVAQD